MSTVASPLSPLAVPPPLPASTLPNGGSRDLAEDVFQTAQEAVLTQDPLPVAGDSASSPLERGVRRTAGNPSFMGAIRSQVAARPGQSVLLAAAAGALVAAVLRRQVSRR